MVGSLTYLFCVTYSVVDNDPDDYPAAVVTAVAFVVFSLLQYLSGDYFPLIKKIKGVLLPWNPFLREPQFMHKVGLSMYM